MVGPGLVFPKVCDYNNQTDKRLFMIIRILVFLDKSCVLWLGLPECQDRVTPGRLQLPSAHRVGFRAGVLPPSLAQ